MTEDTGMSAREFGPAFKRFLEQATHAEPRSEPHFVALLRAHFGTDPTVLPILTEGFEPSEHPNVQVAVDGFVGAGGARACSPPFVTSSAASSCTARRAPARRSPPCTWRGG